MIVRCCCVLLLLVSAAARGETADLSVTVAASPSNGLATGEILSVSVRVRNHGPASATPSISVGLGSNVPFYLEFVHSPNAACGEAQMLDYSPPAFVIDWSPAFALAAGGEITCVAQLRARLLPPDLRVEFFAATSVSPPITDVAFQNNLAKLVVLFRQRMRIESIPALTPWACAFFVIVVLLGSVIPPRSVACGGRKASRS